MWRYYCAEGFRILMFSLRIFCFVTLKNIPHNHEQKLDRRRLSKKVSTSIKSLKWTHKKSWASKKRHFTSTINRGKTLYPRKVYWNRLKGLPTSHIMAKASLNKNFTSPKTLVWCIACFTNFTGNYISLRFPRNSCQYLQYYIIVNVTSGYLSRNCPFHT